MAGDKAIEPAAIAKGLNAALCRRRECSGQVAEVQAALERPIFEEGMKETGIEAVARANSIYGLNLDGFSLEANSIPDGNRSA